MALADIEADLVTNIPWRTCSVCHHLGERSEDWGNRLRRMLANREIRFKDLAARLANDPEEPTIPWEALSRHARAGCAAKEALR